MLGWNTPMRAGSHSHDQARLWIIVQVRCQWPRNRGDTRCAGRSHGITAASCRAAGGPTPGPLAIPRSRTVSTTRRRLACVARRGSRCADIDMVPTMPRWTVHELCTPASVGRWEAPNGVRSGAWRIGRRRQGGDPYRQTPKRQASGAGGSAGTSASRRLRSAPARTREFFPHTRGLFLPFSVVLSITDGVPSC